MDNKIYHVHVLPVSAKLMLCTRPYFPYTQAGRVMAVVRLVWGSQP